MRKIWSRQKKKNNKRPGRKAQWHDSHVADMVDVICSNDNFARKLIFTNSKNTKNNEVYCKVQKEVEKRYTGSSNFPYSTGQMRTKFKRCIAECKTLALTIKTATGVKRIQEERGYGPWFNQLFSLVQSRQCSIYCCIDSLLLRLPSIIFRKLNKKPPLSILVRHIG